MDRIEAPKGTQDVLPQDSARWQAVERIARETANLYAFREIRTPIFEHTELFHRGVGETSDVVNKETYTFEDRGNRSITLRPEGTAGVVRSMIEHNLINMEGARQKVFYIGPNFRYERPQAGRLRQHHQFGVEAFGVASPEQDVECIALQMEFYKRCGLKDLELRVNSLGDRESKAAYRQALLAYLEPMRARLSEDSQRRLETNPLRILDSKDPRDVECCLGAPAAADSLLSASRAHYEKVQSLLGELQLPYRVSPTLVRGFDYYSQTLWEVTAGGLGAQNAVGGGGRYDNLVEQLGGKPCPGVGFGSGLERLLIALEKQGVALPASASASAWLAYHGEAAMKSQILLMQSLRSSGISCDMDLSGRSLKAQFKLADREKAKWCIIVGEQELTDGAFVLKDLATGNQERLSRDALLAKLAPAR